MRAPSLSTLVSVSVSSLSISSLHAVSVSSSSSVSRRRRLASADSLPIAGSASNSRRTSIVGVISRRWRSCTMARSNSQTWVEVSKWSRRSSLKWTSFTSFQPCNSRMLWLTLERATFSVSAISSACIGRPLM